MTSMSGARLTLASSAGEPESTGPSICPFIQDTFGFETSLDRPARAGQILEERLRDTASLTDTKRIVYEMPSKAGFSWGISITREVDPHSPPSRSPPDKPDNVPSEAIGFACDQRQNLQPGGAADARGAKRPG